MLASQSLLLSTLKDRRLHVLLVLLLVAGVYLLFSKPNKDRLVEKLNSQIREEKFGEIYDEAWDNLPLNVTKEQFISRMKAAVSKMKAIDADLNFQRDREFEHDMFFAGEGAETLTVYQRLRKDGRGALISFVWTSKGEFMDIQLQPTLETPREYFVSGVGYLYIDGRMAE